MKTLLLAVFAALLSASAFGEPIKLKNGKVYEAKEVKREEQLLVIITEQAEFTVKWDELEEKVGRKYFPDIYKPLDEAQRLEIEKGIQARLIQQAEQEKAMEAAVQKEKALEEQKQRQANSRCLAGKIISVTDEGLLIRCIISQQNLTAYPLDNLLAGSEAKARLLVNHPHQLTVTDGDKIVCLAFKEQRIFKYISTDKAERTVEVWSYMGAPSSLSPPPDITPYAPANPTEPVHPVKRLNPNPINKLK